MKSKILLTVLSLLFFTSSVFGFSITQSQANTLETILLGLMGLSGVALLGLTAMKYKSESDGDTVTKAEAKNKLRSTQSYVTNQIEMGETLPQEDTVIGDLEQAADLVQSGDNQAAMRKLEEIEEILGKEFSS